jgi:hypothetical protein
MRTFYAAVCCFLLLQFFASCQKQLSFTDTVTAAGDSLTLIKTINTINYDSNDVFDWAASETFTYDSLLNRTVVNLVDSGAYINGQVQRYTEIFQYDAQHRLSQYTSDGTVEPAVQIDFVYNTSGDLAKTVMQDRWVGGTVVCGYNTSTAGGAKTITVYDTSGIYNSLADTRPEISKYTFDAGSRLVNETIYYTYYRVPKNLYEDTLTTNFFYDNNNFIYKVTDRDSYHSSPNNPPPVVTTDSALYTAEGSAVELRNSFFYVYKNMYWLNISEYSTGFADAINKGGLLPYGGAAIKTGEYWTFEPPDVTVQDHQLGNYQNTFDAHGLLVKSVYPKNFAINDGGKAEVSYTYTKIKK